MRSLATRLVPGHWSRICISVPVACWLQYGHKLCMYVTRCVFSMVNLRVEVDWWLWVRNLVSDMGLCSEQILRWGGILYRLMYKENPCIMKCA